MMKRPEVEWNGKQIAIVLSALFMSVNWPFRMAKAVALMAALDRTRVEWLEQKIMTRSRSVLDAAGVGEPADQGWSQELAAARCRVEAIFVFEPDEIALLSTVLAACELEFVGPSGWHDFCVASPGDIAAYGAVHDDLVQLVASTTALAPPGAM